MDEEYKQPDISKVVERLMDEEGYEFGEAVKEAMEMGYKDGGLMVAIQRFNQGGNVRDSRATTQDFTNALRNVSAGTTYQQQADAKRYARNEAQQELRAARQGGDVALDNFLKSAGLSNYRSTFTNSRPGTNRQGAFTGTYKMNMDSILDSLMNKKLQTTSYGGGSGGVGAPRQKSALELKIEENKRLFNNYTKNNPSTINPNPSLLGNPGVAQLNTPGSTPSGSGSPYTNKDLLSQLTMLTPEEAFAGETFDTLSDLDQYNFSQAFTQFQPQLRDPTYVSPYGPIGMNQIFNRRYGIRDGGMAGNKTYHQFHDQYVPMDEESMGYAYGGGIGSMMQPRMNFAGGGGDFEPLGYDEDESITVEDFSESFSPPMYRPVRSVGGVKLKEMPAGVDQSGIISAATNIMSPGVNTIEGSLIDGDDPSSRYGVQQDFPSTIDRFSNSTGPVPNVEATYEDMIMNPEGFPNALQNLERFQDNRFEDLAFQKGFDFIDAPNKVSNLSELYQNRNYIDNPKRGFIDNPESLMNKTKNKLGDLFSGAKDGIVNTGQRFKEGASKVPSLLIQAANFRNPLNPKASNYNPNLVGQLNALDGMTGTVTSGDYGKMKDGIFGSNTGAMLVNNPNSGLLQYGPGSVLRGQGAISGFGTNDYVGQLDKYIDKMKQRAIKKDLSKFQSQKLADAIAERQREIDRQAAVNAASQAAAKAKAQTFMQKNPNYGNNYNPDRAGGYTGAKDSYGDKSGTRQSNARSSELGFSDIRLKDNIELVGKSPSDINIYNFTYLNDPKVYQGVMAQEVPWASVKHNNGYLMVDYNKVDVDFKAIR